MEKARIKNKLWASAPLSLTCKTACCMLALGAPLILLHACDYISQNTVPGSGNYARDVVLFDMFCGKEALTQAYREHGLKTLSYDVELQPETHDLTSTSGWLRGLQYTLRLVEQELLHGGPPCGTFVFINRATSKRNSVDADGDPCVRSVGIANTITIRFALLMLVAIARCCFVAVEQPRSSVMPGFSPMAHLQSSLDGLVPWDFQHFWMSTWGSLTAKPSMPFAAGLYRKLSKAASALAAARARAERARRSLGPALDAAAGVKESKGDQSPASSAATTIPGSDGEAQRMAAENNAIRLAEIQQYQQRKKNAPLGSQTTDLLGSGSTPEQPSKLRRVSSSPIFSSNPAEVKKKITSKKQKKQKKGRAKKTNNKKGKKGSKNKRRVKEARVREAEVNTSVTAQQGQDEKQKQQQEQNQEQQKHVAQPGGAPKQQQQQAAQKKLEPVQQHKAPEVKQEPHEAVESQQPIVPVATPARSNLPPPAVADKLVHDMLNRTATQEQLQQTPQAPGKPEPAQPPQSKTPNDIESRPAKKGRDPVRHARKQKFYRSLESPNSPQVVKELARRAREGSKKNEKLAVLFEEWAASGEDWKKSKLVIEMRTKDRHRVRGSRRWLTESEISAKYNSPEIAKDICRNKLENEQLRATTVREHPDLPGRQDMWQYLIFDFSTETEDHDEILTNLFQMEDASSDEAGHSHAKKKDTQKKKKTKGKSSKSKKKGKQSSSSSSSSSSSKSANTVSSSSSNKKTKKSKKDKKNGKRKDRGDDGSPSRPAMSEAEKKKMEKDKARQDEKDRKKQEKEDEKRRKEEIKEEKQRKEKEEKEAKREQEKEKEKKRSLVRKEIAALTQCLQDVSKRLANAAALSPGLKKAVEEDLTADKGKLSNQRDMLETALASDQVDQMPAIAETAAAAVKDYKVRKTRQV